MWYNMKRTKGLARVLESQTRLTPGKVLHILAKKTPNQSPMGIGL